MPAILEWTHTVVEHDLDGLGHANNISYLKWMQSAALAHSAAQGWPVEAYAALGCVGREVSLHRALRRPADSAVLLADGSARFLSAQIDPALLLKLATVDGGEEVGDYGVGHWVY